MQISTISGHLTVTNKKHIKALFDAKLSTGKVNRINYFISFHIDFWSVQIVQTDKNNSSGIEKSKATFKIN
ncbi:hypothetical protein [Flavobacterium psychrophilum]|uniref:Uncharacterized protein n=1 Tax=Flavobacterium psychrophilum TaxID=96345 RepID=A0A7U2NE88_FLAPS|nr:hypothetical protein [Flavobacterium psychrophilum]QRE03487.1 hypothetical protein H0H26_11440 [Flavobacterium psychrophilum]